MLKRLIRFCKIIEKRKIKNKKAWRIARPFSILVKMSGRAQSRPLFDITRLKTSRLRSRGHYENYEKNR